MSDDKTDKPEAQDSANPHEPSRASDTQSPPGPRPNRKRSQSAEASAESAGEGTKEVRAGEGSGATPPPTSAAGGGEGGKDVPAFAPAKSKVRDWVLFLVPLVVLALIMLYGGDVVNPRGDDPAHALGHYRSLLHSGHIPGGVIFGIILTFLSCLGLFGVLGDSPLDLRGDERTPDALGPRPWYRREGLWLVGVCVLLYVPLAGAYGLWDPWETHYAEVAREILARDDWITLWWGQEGWFMSKPILIFWMSALGMGVGSAFGLPFWRDMGPGGHEWFIRMPIVLFTIGAVYAVYRAVAAPFGRRAGLIAGLVLATMPHWFFLSHQAMTDMPFIAPLVVAMSFLLLAATVDPAKLAQPRAVKLFGRTFRISTWHWIVGAIFVVAMPQILYLLTRRVQWGCFEDADRSCQAVLEASRLGPIQFPIERYWSGSAANSALRDLGATVPGSPAWEDRYNQVPFFPSFVQGFIWLVLAVFLALSFRRERKLQSLFFSMMYLFGAISFMGKGPAGLFLPEIILLGFMITTGKWQMLGRIRVLQGIGIYLICGFPWYIAIYGRLGNEFFDRFVVHDLLNRAFAGVHGDTGTFRYFVWQLGYALFPWTGFAPVALAGWKLYLSERATEAQRDLARLTMIWFIVTFTLFSLMVTKFHHYIFPSVPAVAILVGLLMHRLLGARQLGPTPRTAVVVVSTLVGMALLVMGVGSFFGSLSGYVSHEAPYKAAGPNVFLGVVFTGLAIAVLLYSYLTANKAEVATDIVAPEGLEPVASEQPSGGAAVFREGAPTEPAAEELEDGDPFAKFNRVGLAATGVGAAVLLAVVARDIGWAGASRPAGFERFIHLFVYNYDRPFPTRSFDYHALLTGFGVAAVIAAALVAVRAARRHAVRMMTALAVCFAVWGLDKYMIDLSHHWSQRTLFERYYALRHTRDTLGVGEDARYWADPIVAYQMNWKGENFYTGNHAAMLECGLPLCHDRTNDWLQRHRGQHVFFVTEHSRAGSIMGQVRQANGTANTVTTEYDNNKFVLIEAQL